MKTLYILFVTFIASCVAAHHDECASCVDFFIEDVKNMTEKCAILQAITDSGVCDCDNETLSTVCEMMQCENCDSTDATDECTTALMHIEIPWAADNMTDEDRCTEGPMTCDNQREEMACQTRPLEDICPSQVLQLMCLLLARGTQADCDWQCETFPAEKVVIPKTIGDGERQKRSDDWDKWHDCRYDRHKRSMMCPPPPERPDVKWSGENEEQEQDTTTEQSEVEKPQRQKRWHWGWGHGHNHKRSDDKSGKGEWIWEFHPEPPEKADTNEDTEQDTTTEQSPEPWHDGGWWHHHGKRSDDDSGEWQWGFQPTGPETTIPPVDTSEREKRWHHHWH